MRHSALLSILVTGFLLGGPVLAELEPPQPALLTTGLNLLGVSATEGGAVENPLVDPTGGETPPAGNGAEPPRAEVPVPRADGECSSDADLRRWIHRDRQQTAVIVRGGRFGIAPEVQALVGRIADLLDGMPDIQRFLRETFQRNYLSDEAAIRRQLEGMGYRVLLLTSAEHGTDLKARVTAALGDASTSLLIFFGHNGPNYMGLTDRRENSAPGLGEIRDQIQGREQAESSMSSEEIKAAMGDRRLSGMILQGCQGGMSAYLAEKAGRATVDFGTCVETDRGFFAGWVTYSVYFTPKTSEIVNRYFCHLARVKAAADGARGVDLRESARFWKKNTGITRKMAEIAGMSDRNDLGASYAVMDADANVHAHTEEQIPALAGLEIFIDLAHSVKTQNTPLGNDVRTFITRYYRYCIQNRIPLERDGRAAPALGENPSIEQINAFMEFHGRPILRDAFRILLPNIAFFNGGRVRIDPADTGKLVLDLDLDLRNARELDQGLNFLRSIVEQPLTANVAAIPGGIGPQLATRIRGTLDMLRTRLPNTIASLRISLTIEKRIQGGNVSLRPLVHSYNLAIGEVPAATRNAGRSPYQVHVSLAAASALARVAANPLMSQQTELSFSRGPITVYGYIKLWSLGNITGSGSTLAIPSIWELEVNWPNPAYLIPFTNNPPTVPGYAYTDIDVSARFAPVQGQPLQVSITPTVNIRLRSGWPGGLTPAILSPIITQKVNQQIAANFGNTIDLAQFIPASVIEEVRGRVRLGTINVSGNVLSVTFEHE